MRHQVAKFTLARLEPADASALWSLHSFVRSHAPHGFLAARKRAMLEGIVRREMPGVAVGAYVAGRLVGYSLSRRLSTDNPLATAMRFPDSSAYVGLGTAVHPDWTGHVLMARLLRLRGACEVEAGGRHVVGLIDVRNLASVGNAFRAGAVLVGTLRDATSLNWVAYAGRWFDPTVPYPGSMIAAMDDLVEQDRLFSRDWGACGLKARPERHLVFRQLPRQLCGLGLDGWTMPE
jgi:hypothetical protein